jgi:hypothetical protein
MPFRSRSNRICTCAQFLRIACAGACAAVRLGLAQTSTRSIVDAHPLVVAGQATPLMVSAGPLTKGARNAACAAGSGTARLPNLGARRHQDGPLDSGTCHAVAGRVSIAADVVADRLGWQPLWRDLLLAPYLRQLHLGLRECSCYAEGIPGKSPNAPRRAGCRTRRWELRRRRSLRFEDLVLAGTAQQTLDLTADTPSVYCPYAWVGPFCRRKASFAPGVYGADGLRGCLET